MITQDDIDAMGGDELEVIKSLSLLGIHKGVLDDDLFDLLVLEIDTLRRAIVQQNTDKL